MIPHPHDPAGFQVRVARADDADALRAVVQAAYAPYLNRMDRPPAPLLEDYAAAAVGGHAWVVERDQDVIGLMVVEPAGDYLLVENLAVLPEAQGLGLGVHLLELAGRLATSLGLMELRLYTNEVMTENLTYYRRRGFEETHRGIHDGYRRVFFSKQLHSEEG